MAVISHDLTVASFALWAGDWCYLDTLIEKDSVNNAEGRSEEGIENLIRRFSKDQLNHYQKKRSLFLKEGGLSKYLVLETEHIRSTIWYISDFEYCMRGYLKDLQYEYKFFSCISPSHDLESIKDYNVEPSRLSVVWKSGKNKNCITRIDEMGLIESIYYICDFDIQTRQKKALEHFTEVLRKFNDGDPKYSLQELKNNSW